MNVVVYPLPCGVHGFVCENADGSHTIVLNSCETHENNIKTYLHELKHIAEDDFRRLESADALESIRHGG